MSEITLVAWRGYKSLVEEYADLLLNEYDLRIKVIEEFNADEIHRRFSGSPESYDIVIVDWEYRNLYDRLVTPIPEKHVRLTDYLEPFSDSYLYEVGTRHRLKFIPVRFGTNGFLYRPENFEAMPSRFSRPLQEMLQGMADSNRGGARAAMWDWWLPNLMLLARAQGFNPPHKMTESNRRDLRKGILRDYINSVRAQRQRKLMKFGSLPDIITYELNTKPDVREVDWILGPSEMIVAPVCRFERVKRLPDSLDWDIPKEGGLVWLETVALSRGLEGNDAKRESAYRFLEFLQSDTVQSALICGGSLPRMAEPPQGHWSYALNNVRGLEHVSSEIKSAFRNKAFTGPAREFGRWVASHLSTGQLTLRCLPEEAQPWRDLWSNAVAECRTIS